MTIPGIPFQNPLSYKGPPQNIVPIRMFPREPTTSDTHYPVGFMGLIGPDPMSGTKGDLWYLSEFDANGQAIWKLLLTGSNSPGIVEVTTDDGSPPVEPDVDGNLNIFGGTSISVTGNGPGDTVTISYTGSTNPMLSMTTDDGAPAVEPDGSGNINIFGGTGIQVTGNGPGDTITITSTAFLFDWTVVTDSTQSISVNNGYFANNAGGVTFTLPATAVVGDIFTIAAMNAGGWIIAQNAGQNIRLGTQLTTTGVGGSLASTAIGNSITLVCYVADTSFMAIDSIGNLTIT